MGKQGCRGAGVGEHARAVSRMSGHARGERAVGGVSRA